MGLDIFFSEDIRNALLAADEASSATAAIAAKSQVALLNRICEELRRELPSQASRRMLEALRAAAIEGAAPLRQYRAGYKAALTTIALAFGLSPAAIFQREPAGQLEAPASDRKGG
jgi:hypothetical protein